MMLEQLARDNGKDWSNIFQNQAGCEELKKDLTHFLEQKGISLTSSADLVVFGSFARQECSDQSDIDWTLLIDGSANTNHFDIGQFIQSAIKQFENEEPGFTGVFGQMTFSHDLIHFIGGQEDTNPNLTRRILMLLESSYISLKNDSGSAFEGVLAGIIDQYIDNDSGYYLKSEKDPKVPRVLLNDFIRFWRTMCVDFAYKQRQQNGKKWAIRNIKLRMSRKLIFIKGLLMCYSCYAKGLNKIQAKSHLKEAVLKKTPLECISEVLKENDIDQNRIVGLISAYEEYLKLISDSAVRKEWEEAPMEKLEEIPSF